MIRTIIKDLAMCTIKVMSGRSSPVSLFSGFMRILCGTIVVFLVAACLAVRSTHADIIKVGDGPARIVLYDQYKSPKTAFVGFEEFVDCRVAIDNTILVAESSKRVITRVDQQGKALASWTASDQPIRIHVNKQLDLLIVSQHGIEIFRPDGSKVTSVAISGIVDAAFGPSGAILVVRRANVPEIGLMDSSGSVQWRALSDGKLVTGLQPLISIDMTSTDTILVSDGRYLVSLNDDLSPIRRWDTRIGSSSAHGRISNNGGEMFFDYRGLRLGFFDHVGLASVVGTPMFVSCGDVASNGDFVVGYFAKPGGKWLARTRFEKNYAYTLHWELESLATAISFAIFLSCSLVLLERRRFHRGVINTRASATTGPSATPGRSVVPNSADELSSQQGYRYFVGLAAGGAGIALSCAALIKAISLLRPEGSIFSWGVWLMGGAVAGAASLNILTRVHRIRIEWPFSGRADDTLSVKSRFSPQLFALSFMALVVCLGEQYRSGDSRMAIGAWVAAQVFFIGAFQRCANRCGAEERTLHTWLLGVVLLVAAVSRLWEIGGYPDVIHHDHLVMGESALRFLLGEWNPFFVIDPLSGSLMRPWVVPISAFISLFGEHLWVLRLSSALWFVALVYGCYKLGAVLLCKRLGLLFACLVTVQHSLLLYSRQVFITEAAAPFILSLYFIVLGLRSDSLRPWASAGLWVGYSMLSPRSCSQYPAIWLALFMWCCVIAPSVLWKRRKGVLVLLIGALVVGIPFFSSFFSSAGLMLDRLSQNGVLLGPGFTIKGDAALWSYQLSRSFGALLLFWDTGAWAIKTEQPILTPYGVALFSVGMVCLMTQWRRLVFGFTVLPIIGALFLGSAMLIDPPGYFHILVALILPMLIVAIPLEQMMRVGDNAARRTVRFGCYAVVVTVLGLLCRENVMTFWSVVQRPTSASYAPGMWSPQMSQVIARAIDEHKPETAFIVKRAGGFGAHDAIFHFVAFHSNIMDIAYDLADELPLPPSPHKGRTMILVLPERAAEVAYLRELYPQSDVAEIYYGDRLQPVTMFLIEHAEVEYVYRAGRKVPRSDLTVSYALNPIK